MPPAAADRANQRMVDRLIAEGALWSPQLIAAFRATPRHRFLDRVFQFARRSGKWRETATREPRPEVLDLLYSDRALITRLSTSLPDSPEGLDPVAISSSSQPSLMAQMLEDLRVAPGQRVLEVGAGTGYNAALLAHVVGPGQVYSIDIDREVLKEAWEHLEAFSERQVRLRHADGRAGYAEAAPYDRVMLTAATEDVEPAWLEQLADCGLLIAPLALAPGLAYVVRGTADQGYFQGRPTRAAYFMPLRSENEAGKVAPDAAALPACEQTLPAPWAGWFDRRTRPSWLGFSQALAFFGWLRGLSVHYRGDESLYAVAAPGNDEICWLGAEQWRVSGPGGRELGQELWREFLDAGGPRPTEFRLRAAPGGGVRAGATRGYLRRGARCEQLWELIAVRDRPDWL